MNAGRQRVAPAVATEVSRAPPPAPSSSLVVRFGERFGIEPGKMLETLRATAFKTETPASNEQLMALLVVAEQYNLNPFTRELFAFLDKHSGGIVPVVSVDGWARIVNEHPQYDGAGFDFEKTPEGGEMTCTMYRKDRSHPTVVTEYMSECKRNSIPWQATPRRMLRHRSFIQAARLAFGFGGIFDEQEARDVVDMGAAQVVDDEPQLQPKGGTAKLRAAMEKGRKPKVPAADAEPEPEPTEANLSPETVFDRAALAIRNAPDREEAAHWLEAARDELPEGWWRELAEIYSTTWQQDSSAEEPQT